MTASALLVLVVLGRIRRYGTSISWRRRADADWWQRQPIVGAVLRWVAVAALVAAGTAAGLLWLFGFPSMPGAGAFNATQVLDLLKIALTVVAGLGGVVLLAVNLRKQRVTESEHLLAQAKDEREQAQSFNERFGTAAEQLAHENATVRLAGLYAMAGLADDWVENRQICVDVLCGYLRLPQQDDESERKVRESLLRVLVERLDAGWRGSGLDLDLTGVRFSDPAVMELAASGSIRFDRAIFEEAEFALGPRLADSVSYEGAEFRGSVTRFESSATFVGSEFSGRLLFGEFTDWRGGFTFLKCRFVAVEFAIVGWSLHDRIRFDNCDFVDCTFDFSVLDTPLQPGREFVVADSRISGGAIDLRGRGEYGLVLSLRRSKVEGVTFALDPDPVEGQVKVVGMTEVEVANTSLPDLYTRVWSADAVS